MRRTSLKKTFFYGTALAIIAMILVVMQTNAQVKKGKERPLQTRHLMTGLIGPHNTALGKAFQGSGPEDDKAWDVALQNAELLNESAYIMMADGRCPDDVWAEASKVMREGSASLIRALEKKDLEAARTAHGDMTKSCAGCHKAHKKKPAQ
jgi:hypothetical protein